MSSRAGFVGKFLACTEAGPDRMAISGVEGPGLTYAQLLELAERYRQAFIHQGVRAGEPVVLMLPPGAHFVASLYALASLGAVAVPVSHKITAHELIGVLQDARPVGAVRFGEVAAQVRSCLAGCVSLRFTLLADGPLGEGRSPLEEPSGNPVVTCHFTYKGLGYPLGVPHRYHDYAVCCEGLQTRFPQAPGFRVFVGLPTYPVYSLTAVVMTPLSLGANLIVGRQSHAARMLELLQRCKVDVACVVPVIMRLMVQQARSKELSRPLAGVQLTSGGSWLNPELAGEAAEVLGTEPYQGYGLTETLPVTANYPGHSRPGSLGRVVSDAIRVSVRDGAGRPCATGQVGQIWIGGPTVTEGFWRRPRETARFLRDGWFHTGDLGHFDAEGYLHFDGWSLPIAKVMAQMVDLVEIEKVLLEHPVVADARVTVHLQGEAEQLLASVSLRKNATVRAQELSEFVESRLSRHKVPGAWKLYDRRVTLVEAR